MTSDISTLTAVKTATRAPKTVRRNRKVVSAVANLVKKPARIVDLLKKRAAPGSKSLALSWGADPEMWTFDREQNRIVSSIPILKRDKHNPIDLGDGAKIYSDNVACELSFRPSFSIDEMMARLKDVFGRAQAHLGDRYSLLPQAAHVFQDEELVPSEGISPLEVGCNPSYCARTASINLPIPFSSGLRTGSFHIHVGNVDYASENDGRLLTFNSRHDTIKLLNIYVGLASVIYSRDETSKARRAIYGRGFEFRPTVFGCEFRTTEPYPLRSPELTRLTLDLAEHAVSHISKRTEASIINSVDLVAVGAAIDDCDKHAAFAILSKLDLSSEMLARVKKDYGLPVFSEAWGLK